MHLQRNVNSIEKSSYVYLQTDVNSIDKSSYILFTSFSRYT